MEPLGFMAIDQYGQTFHLKTKFPRKELLEQFDRTRADKMYQDKQGSEPEHVGYIIAGHWLSVYTVQKWKAQKVNITV